MKKKLLKVGKGLYSDKSWVFDKNIARHFDRHVNQSVPQYKELQKYIGALSIFFLRNNSIIYDLGCSTGQTIQSVIEQMPENLKCNFIGIDNQLEMLNLAKKRIKKNNIQFLNKDITKYQLKKSNLIFAILLLNFFEIELQNKILKNIYNSLKPNGAAIIVNKVLSSSPNNQSIFDQMYVKFKIDNKLSHSEIINKQISLRTSMTLLTNKEYIKKFEEVGFKNIEIFYRWFNFVGYIVTK